VSERTSIAEPGHLVDRRYRVRREIARGGMAVVLEAEHIHLKRRVALKMIHGREVDAKSLSDRLMREALALELSRSPYVVEVLDAGIDGTSPYVALEMLDGRALDSLVAMRGKLPMATAVGIAVELCQALDGIHRAGVVHRDVKPSNVFVTRLRGGAERSKLIDFGIARIPGSDGEGTPKLTREGDLLGTLEYMAPEQLLGETADARADLFSLGLVFYECVAGELPVQGGARALMRSLAQELPLPSLSKITGKPEPALDAFVARWLARDPDKRPSSASAIAAELLRVTGLTTAPLKLLEAPPPPPAAAARPQRHFARAPYVAPIRVVDASGVVRDGQTADLSEGGLLAMLSAPIELGTKVTLRVGLPVSGRIVQLDGVARWMREARHRRAIGFEFAEPAPDARDEIRRFVEITTRPVTGRGPVDVDR
jgi:serine/threonine-protein kinase